MILRRETKNLFRVGTSKFLKEMKSGKEILAQSHRQLTNHKVCCLLQHFDRLTLWRLNSKLNIWAKSFKATREKTEDHEACKTRKIQSECNNFFSKKTLTILSPSYFEIIGGA
jgi:hypothetical protein